MKRRLIWKLLLINLLVIGFVLVIVWVSIDFLAAGYFVTLMERYQISPKPAHAMFLSAVHRYLLWACLAAAILATALSFLMMRRVLSPLTRMTTIARQIAAGDFDGRVPSAAADEVGQLAAAFNRMAKSLEEIENLRRSLMIDVAHELRTPHGGSLEIHVVPGAGRVQVALTNTAENIRPEDIPFIFERFFRGEKSRSREHGGAGIGLAIVKELVEAHGGSVGARLEEDRVRIWFELPA